MSDNNLQTLYIKDTYKGLLHSGGAPLVTSGVSQLYDGSGQASSLSVGVSSNGAYISGPLGVSGLVTIGSGLTNGSHTVLGLLSSFDLSVSGNASFTGATITNLLSSNNTYTANLSVGNTIHGTDLFLNATNSINLNSNSVKSDNLDITGLLKANGLSYPTLSAVPTWDQVMTLRSGSNILTLVNFLQLLYDSGWNPNLQGVYERPDIEFNQGMIVGLSANPVSNSGIVSFATGTQTFTVPSGIRKVKAILTGGGSIGKAVSGNAGSTLIAYLNVKPGDVLTVNVGNAGEYGVNNNGGKTSLIYNSNEIAYANGGTYGSSSGATSGVTGYATGIITSSMIIPGGVGNIDTDEGGSEEDSGAASYWGKGPAYGGAQGSHSNQGSGIAGTGVAVFEY